jgi:hypothetical protein
MVGVDQDRRRLAERVSVEPVHRSRWLWIGKDIEGGAATVVSVDPLAVDPVRVKAVGLIWLPD